MSATWVQDETIGVDFGDTRLDKRLDIIVAAFGAMPQASVAAASGSRNDMEAAYEFFANPKVTPDEILSGHIAATHRRIDEQPVVVLVQDTTEINVTRPQSVVDGAGPLDGGSRRGGFVHPLMAFTPDGTPLGTVACKWWTRDDVDADAKKPTRAERAAMPIEEKESVRWVTTLCQAHAVAAAHPTTQIVCVADSESDIYEVLREGQKESGQAKWVVRACQDRVLRPQESSESTENPGESSDSGMTLRSRLAAQPVLFTHTVTVRERQSKVPSDTRNRRQSRSARTATMEVRATTVTLRGPQRPGGRLLDVTVNGVLVTEGNVPEGEAAIEWMLMTNLSIDSLELVQMVIAYYCARWMIEVYFRVLKSGCRLEARRFEAMDRIWNFTAVCMVVAWRTLLVCRLGREMPDVSCKVVFDPAEWQSVYVAVTGEAAPSEPPTLHEMVRLVAQLGGFVNRAKGAEPGPETIWKGLQRMHDYAHAWDLFGPGAKQKER